MENKIYYSLEILTTTACNMNCTYCFEGHKPQDKGIVNQNVQVYFDAIDKILESQWFKDEYTDLLITFWGGEPTINTKIMTDIITKYQDTNIMYYLYTNGYQTSKFKSFIASLPPKQISKLQVQVSYDGKILNDKYRVTTGGKSTMKSVLETFEYLSTLPINSLNFKQTLPINECNSMFETWKEFEELHYKYIDKGKEVKVKDMIIGYSPTVDSFGSIDDKYLEDFKQNINKITKAEIEFYNKNGRFLMTWFGGDGEKNNCSTGVNMSVIDEDGKMYACHGVLYLKDKLKHEMADFKNINKLTFSRDKYKNYAEFVNKECKNCIATTCLICPTTIYSKSLQTNEKDKWTDRMANEMCSFYKYFGKVDRSLQNYVYKEK